MTDKNEVLELAKKCGANLMSGRNDDNEPKEFFEIWPEQLLAIIAALEEKLQSRIMELEMQSRGNWIDAEQQSQRVIECQAQIAMLIEAGEAAMRLDYFREHNALAKMMQEALSATQQSSEAFLAEVRAKSLEEGALIAARVKCPEEWTSESKHAWDMATAAAYQELRRMAAELRSPERTSELMSQPDVSAASHSHKLDELADLREKCEELQRKLDESAEQIRQYSIREGKLQRERDEAAKQEPYLFECVAPSGRDDLLDEEKWTIVDSVSVADYRDDGYFINPLYRLPPNLPALIEQAKAEYREDALRYRALRDQDINGDDFPRSGLFIGKVPDNLCLTGVDADMAVDEVIRARSEK